MLPLSLEGSCTCSWKLQLWAKKHKKRFFFSQWFGCHIAPSSASFSYRAVLNLNSILILTSILNLFRILYINYFQKPRKSSSKPFKNFFLLTDSRNHSVRVSSSDWGGTFIISVKGRHLLRCLMVKWESESLQTLRGSLSVEIVSHNVASGLHLRVDRYRVKRSNCRVSAT